MNNTGVTLLEMLAVLAIIGVIIILSLVWFSPSVPRRAAQELQRLYINARNLAILQNETVAVVPANRANTIWHMKLVPSYADCASGTVLYTLSLPKAPTLSVVPSATYGGEVVWTPNGSPRSCGSGLTNQTITIGAPFQNPYEVVISNLGRVNVQAQKL